MSKLNILDNGERLIPKMHPIGIAYGEHMSRYYSIIDCLDSKIVLDIASGTGYGTQILATKAKHVYGVDLSTEAVSYSQKNYPAKNIDYLVGDANDIPIKSNTVDVVVSLETIEHLANHEKFLKEVKRVLKPDGTFIVSTPNDDKFISGNVFHLHQFQLPELKQITTKYFQTINYYYQSTYYSACVMDEKDFMSNQAEIQWAVKSFKQNISDALYFIAVCSDNGKNISLTSTAFLSDDFSEKNSIENSKLAEDHRLMLAKKIDELESTVQQYQDQLKKIDELESTVQQYQDQLTSIKGSRTFKTLVELSKIKNKFFK